MDFDFDLFVVGGGSGGVRAARMAAQRGARVALAEGGALGGTCVNVGCIPKKLYSYAAHYGESFAEARGFGWTVEAPCLDWHLLKSRRAAEITRLNGIYRQLLVGAGVTLIDGWARLADAHTIEVAGRRHTARHILLAVGGRPQVPDVPGREHVITSDDIFDLEPFPKRLVVVGGGYIACEFASIFNGLGAKVTLVHRRDAVLKGFDDDIAGFVRREMAKAGVDFKLHSRVAGIDKAASTGLEVRLCDADGAAGETLAADSVLYATGRLPNVGRLGLAEAGVELDRRGSIRIDARFRTSVDSIYALGDAANDKQLTPVALAEAMALVDDLFGPPAGKAPRTMSYEFIPTAVFTHPNVGTVGYSEREARAAFGDVTVFRSEFRALKHTLSGSDERTLVKLLVDPASDRVVGLHMVGPDAGEVTQGFAVALKAGLTKAQFDQTIGIHPTLAEEFVTLREPVAAAAA